MKSGIQKLVAFHLLRITLNCKKDFFSDTGRAKRFAEPALNQEYLAGSYSTNNQCRTNRSCGSAEEKEFLNEDRKNRGSDDAKDNQSDGQCTIFKICKQFLIYNLTCFVLS